MCTLHDDFDEFDPYDNVSSLCPILQDATNIEETPVKHAHAHLRAAHHILSTTVTDFQQISTTPINTLQEPLGRANDYIEYAIESTEAARAHYRDEFPSRQSNTTDPIETHLSGTVTRAKTAKSRLDSVRTATTIKQAHTTFIAARSYTQRAQTQLTALLNHSNYTDCEPTLIWDELEHATESYEGIDIWGYCMVCGKKFERVYTFNGIFDADASEHGNYVLRR